MVESRFYTLSVQRELRRIGVDLARLRGLAMKTQVPPEDFLRWLRTIPGRIGHDAMLRLLEAPATEGGPHAPGPEEREAADVASYRDPEFDDLLAFALELERVVPKDRIARERTSPDDTFGFNLPHGRAHGLAVLRTLPDGAGPSAFLAALATAAPDLVSDSDEPAG